MPVLFKMIFNITKSFVALFNANFHIALLDQLRSTNSSLSMHSILVRIDVMDWNINSGNKDQFD